MTAASTAPPPSPPPPRRDNDEVAIVLQGETARRVRALAARLGTTPLDEISTAVALHLDAMETVEVPS